MKSTGNQKPLSEIIDKLNPFIDADYSLLLERGYGELVVPRSLHRITNDVFPPVIRTAIERLVDAGFNAYLYGGTVRDLLLGQELNDYDLATDATYEEYKIALKDVSLSENLGFIDTTKYYFLSPNEKLLDIKMLKPIPPLYLGKVKLPEDIKAHSPLSHSFSCDLTINAMLYDFSTGDILDYHGGFHDLRDKLLKTVVAPVLFFEDRPEGCLRALRFLSYLDYSLDPALEQALKNMRQYLHRAPHDKLCATLTRFFVRKNAKNSYPLLCAYSVLETVFPSIDKSSDKETYRKKLEALILLFDSFDFDTTLFNIHICYVFAYLLAPRVQELMCTLDIIDASKQVLSEEAEFIPIDYWPRIKHRPLLYIFLLQIASTDLSELIPII